LPGLDDKEFRNEFNNLMRAQHKNIVRLIGYCYDIGHQSIKVNGEFFFAHLEERLLCLEYLEGGSLEKYVSGMIFSAQSIHILVCVKDE
jgi:pyruvate dehydrogenase phosphatase